MKLLNFRLVFVFFLLIQPALSHALVQQFITISLQGVSCPFCIHVLTSNLKHLASIQDARLNSDNNQLIVTLKAGETSDSALINKTITASGFLVLKSSTSSVNIKDQDNKSATKHENIKNQPCSSCHK
jgi:cation transport ATPase